MVPRNYIHGDTIGTQTLKKYFAVAVQCFEVYESTVLIVVAQMQYLGYTVVVQIREEHFVVEAFLVLYEYVTRIADATMCIVQDRDLDKLFLEET